MSRFQRNSDDISLAPPVVIIPPVAAPSMDNNTDWSQIVLQPGGTPRPDSDDYDALRHDKCMLPEPTAEENRIAREVIITTARRIVAEQGEDYHDN